MMKTKAHIQGNLKWEVMRLPDEVATDLKFARMTHGKNSPEYQAMRDSTYEQYGQMMAVGENHNIVTNEGDALIADQLAETPGRTKVDNANGTIQVGVGFSSETKSVDALVTATGSAEAMDSGYPQVKGSWAAADDNVVQYKSTFEVGDLDATGIDEALLGNGTDTLAYAEISPSVDVTSSDSLVVTWELTISGS